MNPYLLQVASGHNSFISFDIRRVARAPGMRRGDSSTQEQFEGVLLSWICDLWKTKQRGAMELVCCWDEYSEYLGKITSRTNRENNNPDTCRTRNLGAEQSTVFRVHNVGVS